MSVEKNLKYSKEHEWVRQDGDLCVIGITDHAQNLLGDIIFVELPEVGTSFETNDEFGSVESVKAVSELYMPISGEVAEVNEALEDEPEIICEDPYNKGWMIKVKPVAVSELDDLMSAEKYSEFIESEG